MSRAFSFKAQTTISNGDIKTLISANVVKRIINHGPSRGLIRFVHVGVAGCFDKHFYQQPLRATPPPRATAATLLNPATSAGAALRIDAALAMHSGPTAPRLHWERHQINYLPSHLSSRCSRNLMTSRAVVYYKPPRQRDTFPEPGESGAVYLQFPPTAAAAIACLSEQVWASKTANPPASMMGCAA